MGHSTEFGIAPVGGRGNKKAPKRLPPPPPAPPAVESKNGYAAPPPAPEVAGPTRSQSSVPIVREPSKAIARAEARQKQLVTKYVTKAYSHKLQKKGVPTEQINLRIEKAKTKLAAERDRLLNHPKVQAANSQGKVVSPKGLSQIVRTRKQTAALEGPKGVTHNQFGLKARSLRIGSGGAKELGTREGGQGAFGERVHEGKVGKTRDIAAAKAHARSEPSTLEDLAYASIGIPGIGIGGDVAKLAEAGATAIPKVLAEGGAKQIASSAGAKVAAKAASAKALPSEVVDALKSAPSALRSAPTAAKAALKETPSALKGAARAAPGAAGRSAERGYQSFGAIGALGGAHKAGVNLPGGAILEGQGKAFQKDPLKVLSSTANLAPSLLVSAFQLPVAAGKSAVEGSSAPLEGALNEQKNFFEHFAKTYGGNNVKAIEQATLKEGLLPEVLLAPAIARGVKGASDLGLKDKVLESRSRRRAPLTDEHGNVITNEHGIAVKKGRQRHPNETHVTRAAENAHLRREEARQAAKTEDITNVEVGHRTRHLESAARKAAGEKVAVRSGLGPKGKDTLGARPVDFLQFLNRAGIDLRKPDAALREIKHYDELFKKQPSAAAELGANPAHLNARDAVNYFLAHPEALKDKHLATALETYRDMANGKTGLNSLSTSDRNRYLGVAAAHDIPLPEHRAYPYLRPPGSDVKTWEDLQHHLESELEGHKANIEARREPTSKGEKGARYGAKPELRAAEAGVRQTRKAAERAKRRVEVAKEQHERDGTVRSRNALEKAERDLARAKGDHKLAVKRAKKARANLSSAIARKNELERGIKRAKVGHERTKEGGAPPRVTLTEAEREAVNNSLPRGATLRDRKAAHRDAIAKKAAQIRKELEREYLGEVRGVIQKRGLHPEPAYVPDISAVNRARPDQAATGGEKQPSGPHINEGYVFKHGLQVQGFQHLLNGVHRSVATHHWFENARRFRTERAIEVGGSVRHDSKEWAQAFQHGHISEKDVVLVPTQVLNRFDRALQGGDPTEYARASAELTGAATAAIDGVPGTKYEAFPKAAWEEFSAQAQKAPVASWLRGANMVTSRAMLSTPSFVAAQIVAETAQAVADTNPARLAQGLYNYSKLSPAEKAKISGVSGETGRAIFSPNKLGNALLSDGKPMKDALSFFRRNLFGRSVKDIVSMKWAGDVNRFTSGLTRRAVLTGEVMQELNGLQRHGRALLGVQTDLQREIGHLSGKEQLAYVAKHPEVLDAYQKKLGAAMGLWNNLTRTGHFPEVYRAAGLVFYPFLRMSVLWPLKYAVNHPIKATALAYLAAQNNFALREALHGEPSFLNYAQIPLYGRNPQTGKIEATNTINLSRMSPGGNAITSAIQGAQSPLGAVQPVIAAGVLGFTGKGPLGEVEGGVGSNLKAAGASILGLSPYVRALDTLRGQKASGQSEFGIFAKRANIAAEPLAALEAKLKGSMQTQLERSLVNPLKPTPINLARDQAKLSRILNTLGENSKSKQSKTSNRAQVIKMQKAGEKAGKELEALYKKYGLGEVAKRDEALYNYSHPYPGSTESGGIYGTKAPTESIYSSPSATSSSIYGGGGEPKPPKIPHETNGISLNLPGLGGITGAISNFLGGTPAQAATLPKGQKQNAAPANHAIARSLPEWGLNPRKVGVLRKVEKETEVPAALLASISKTESSNGTSTLPGVHSGQNSAGAAGPFQIGNGTGAAGNAWQTYAQKIWGKNAPKHSVYNYADAARVAGEYLKEAGATQDPATWATAALSYNHSSEYANEVAGNAAQAAQLPWGKAKHIPSPYVYPFPRGQWEEERIDQGQDFGPKRTGAPILAIGKARVLKTGAPGWPGEGGVLYQLLSGPQKGKVIFNYESVNPTVKPGQIVKKGQIIGRGWTGGTGVESGYANAEGVPISHGEYTEGKETVGGKAFASFLKKLAGGAPIGPGVVIPGSGGTTVSGVTVAAYSQATGQSQKSVRKELKTRKLKPQTMLQKLAAVERAIGGQITPLGIPGLGSSKSSSVGPSVSDLANIAQTLSKERKRLNVS